MRGNVPLDPSRYDDCGRAKTAVYQLLAEWFDIDWFVPPSVAATDLLARDLFQEHHATARAREPELFAPDMNVRMQTGGWDEFRSLANRVRRSSSWDWKYGALKLLSRRHSDALGWAFNRAAPASLTVRMSEDVVIWAAPSPRIEFRKELPEADAELACWYLSYATMDCLDGVIWQLAEESSDLAGNPFVPLLRCYGLGFYPFAVARDEFILTSFAALDRSPPVKAPAPYR